MSPDRSPSPWLALLVLATATLVSAGCGEDGTAPDSDPPNVTIEAPADGASFDLGDAITFRGSATDPEDGAVPGSALRWVSDLDGEMGAGAQIMVDSLESGAHNITLWATDSDGVSGSASIGIVVRPPPASVIGR